MPLPIIAVVAARLGIRLATYMVGKHLKKGAAKKLRKAITKKRAEIGKKKETSEKGYRGQGSKRQEEKVTQRKKPKVASGLSIKKNPKHGSVKQQENTIRRQRIKEEHTKRNLKEKIKAGNLSKKEAIQIAKEHATSSKLSIKDKWNLRSKIPQEERVSNFKKRK